MKKIFFAIFLLASATVAKAQQTIKGDNINDFKSVVLTGDMSVEMIAADKPSVYMELTNLEMEKVTWSVTGNVLSIKVRPSQQKAGALVVKIFYRNIESLDSNGADVIFKGPLKADMFTLEASSGAKITGPLDCLDFQMKLTGNSAAMLDGKSKYLTLTTNQGSKLDARALESQSAYVQAYMASEIYVYSTERLVAETSTGSAVFYRGEPSLVRKSTKLGGNVNNIGK